MPGMCLPDISLRYIGSDKKRYSSGKRVLAAVWKTHEIAIVAVGWLQIGFKNLKNVDIYRIPKEILTAV